MPNENIGDILQLILEKRGTVEHTESLDYAPGDVTANLPLNEILVDFTTRLRASRAATARWITSMPVTGRRNS